MAEQQDPCATFEDALNELHKIVDHMEEGKLTLEQSLKLFERGINLTRQCQQALQNAEQQVQILLEQNGEQQLAEFKTNLEKED